MDDILLDFDARQSRRIPLADTARELTPPPPGELLRLYYALNGMRDAGAPIVLQMLAATRGEGTTTLVRALAELAAADQNQKVLVLDCGSGAAPARRSVVEYFRTGQPLNQIGFIEGRYRAARLSAQRHPLLDLPTRDLRELLDVLRKLFAVILLDCSAASDCPDGAAIARHCDGTILVVRAGAVASHAVQALRSGIERAGGHVAGVVLNRHRPLVPAWLARRL